VSTQTVNSSEKNFDLISSEVSYISPQELFDSFESGDWAYMRPEWYIRTGDNQSVIDEKVQALTFRYPDSSTDGYMQVIDALYVNRYIDENGATVNEIISGNNRVKAIFQQMAKGGGAVKLAGGKGKEDIVKIIDFAPIPYRLFNSPVTEEVAISIQTSTNDNTSSHTPYDLALKIKSLNDTGKYSGSKLAEMFGLSRQRVNQFLIAFNRSTDRVLDLIYQGVISLDTSYALFQKLGKSATNEEIDKIIEYLYGESVALAKAVDNEVLPRIYTSQVNNYFKNIKSDKSDKSEKAESEKAESDDTEKTEATADTKPLTEEEKEKDEFLRESFAEDTKVVSNYVKEVKQLSTNPETLPEVNSIFNNMCKFLVASNNAFPIVDENILNTSVYDLFIDRSNNTEQFEKIDSASVLNLHKLLAKISTSVSKIKKIIDTPADEKASVETENYNATVE
jgi:transcriptional regulator with XRE-family HTH domain